MSRTNLGKNERSTPLQALLLLLGSTLIAPHCTEGPGTGGGEAGAGASAGEGGDGSSVAGSGAGGPPAGGSSNAGSGGDDHAGESQGGVSVIAGAAGEAGKAGEASGERCVEPGEYCTASSQCGPYQRCEQGHCSDVTEGDACTPVGGDVIDCGNGMTCTNDACAKRRIVAPYEDCDQAEAEGAMCPPGTACYWRRRADPEFACVDPSMNTGYCDTILDCKSSHYCPVDWEELGDECLPRGDLAEPCWTSEPYSCKPGLSCNFEKCQPADGPVGTICDSGSGRSDPPFPAMCAAGLFCKPQDDPATMFLFEGVCTPRYEAGAECENGYYCQGGICKNENLTLRCAAPVIDGPCGIAGQCPPNAACAPNQKCRPQLAVGAVCTPSGDPCTTGSVCYSEVSNGTHHCTDVAQLDEDCSMSVCGDGQICIDPANPG
jgi:hypothetical protein